MTELRELEDLREDAAGWARDEARAMYRDSAGLPQASTLVERIRTHRSATSRDGLSQICEALQEAAANDPPRRGRISRLAGLRDLLVRARAQALEPGAFQELREADSRASVELHGDAGLHGMLPICSVERELGRQRSRGERADMEAALSRAVAQSDSVRSAAWEAAASALSEMEAGEPIAAAAALHERGWAKAVAVREEKTAANAQTEPWLPRASSRELEKAAQKELEVTARMLEMARTSSKKEAADLSGAEAIAKSCERLLDKTDAIAGDLGAWLLERESGARPFPGDAERHDVLHLIRAPRCSPAFPRGEMLRSCRRWAEGWRLDLDAKKAIKLDEEDRPLAREGALAAPLDPPDEVRLHLFPEEGPWALEQLLAALGAALLYVGPPGNAPPEDLLCHDPALPIASGAIFSGLIRDDSFRRRCARAELPVDDGRTVGIAHVLQLRIAAAATLASLESHRSGLGGRAASLHRELFARAALSTLPSGLALRGLDPFLSSWALLRGQAFAARTRRAFRERFDVDWWRNPRALQPLRSMWIRGGRSTLRELWNEIAPGEEPTIDALIDEALELAI